MTRACDTFAHICDDISAKSIEKLENKIKIESTVGQSNRAMVLYRKYTNPPAPFRIRRYLALVIATVDRESK
jgi:hypothetical protein